MRNVIQFQQAKTTFIVEVIFDPECSMWVAICDGLHMSTEAHTYEALVERVWLIAPEMAQENGLNIPEDRLRLLFQHVSEHHTVAM